MSTGKEAALARLLQSGDAGKAAPMKGSSLIREIDPAGEVVTEPKTDLPPAPPAKAAPEKAQAPKENVTDDQPSILEMMMAAQREANAEKVKEKAVEAEVEAKKPIGNGFKKGFFGGSAKPKAAAATSTKKADAEVIEVKKAPPAAKAASPYVFDDVQRAMEEDQHPLLKQLKQKDWITPDLTKAFQSNQVLSRGFSDPKCMAAMQLLQTDPKEAQRKFQNDPEVSGFLQEFGKLMAGHFEALGSAQGGAGAGAGSGGGSALVGSAGSAPSSSSSASGNGEGIRIGAASGSSSGAGGAAGGAGIQELGPLHAQALQRKSAGASSTQVVPSAGKTAAQQPSSSSSVGSASKEDEEEKVKKILQDEELRTMVMDPELQRILVECGDPAKFQQHMRNPDTYRKIVRLQQAGLVGTAR